MLCGLAGRTQRLRALDDRHLVPRDRLLEQRLSDRRQPSGATTRGHLIEAGAVVEQALESPPRQQEVAWRHRGKALRPGLDERDEVIALQEGVF